MDDYQTGSDGDWNFISDGEANPSDDMMSRYMNGDPGSMETAQLGDNRDHNEYSSYTNIDRSGIESETVDDIPTLYATGYMQEDLLEAPRQSFTMAQQQSFGSPVYGLEGINAYHRFDTLQSPYMAQYPMDPNVGQQTSSDTHRASFDEASSNEYQGGPAYSDVNYTQESRGISGSYDPQYQVAAHGHNRLSFRSMNHQNVASWGHQEPNLGRVDSLSAPGPHAAVDPYLFDINSNIHDVNSSSMNAREPWSSMFTRRDVSSEVWTRNTQITLGAAEASEASYLLAQADVDASSTPNEEFQSSTSSFFFEVDDMMASFATIRPADLHSVGIVWQQGVLGESAPKESNRPVPRVIEPPHGSPQGLSEGRLHMMERSSASERAERTESVMGPFAAGEATNVCSREANSDLLSIPESDDPTSEGSSPMSVTSDSVPEVLYCDSCSSQYRGKYRKGNRARHMRLKHRASIPQSFVCPVQACSKVFQRPDARLKHIRKRHPWMSTGPAVSRRPSSANPGDI
ncbi:hypothetical protein NX059_006904 [Plenodomus lindquistii]|nr:hypothetical protein NX059_006904 [Plenodomus lindquistii]